MAKFKDVEKMKDIEYISKLMFDEDYGGGRDIIFDIISGFTSNKPDLGKTPKAVTDAITDWIANSDAILYDEDE